MEYGAQCRKSIENSEQTNAQNYEYNYLSPKLYPAVTSWHTSIILQLNQTSYIQLQLAIKLIYYRMPNQLFLLQNYQYTVQLTLSTHAWLACSCIIIIEQITCCLFNQLANCITQTRIRNYIASLLYRMPGICLLTLSMS